MRSERPKPLHLLCGRPMMMHVLDALTDLDVTRTVVVTGHGAERVTKKVQDQSPDALNVVFVEQRVQRGTGDAVSVGLTAFPDDDVDDTSPSWCCPATRPLLRPATIAAPGRGARGGRQRRHRAVGPRRGPDRLRPRPARPRTAGSPASSSSATPPPTSGPSTRSTPASTASAATCSGRPCAAFARQRPGRVLPHRRHRRCCRRPATRWARSAAPTTSRPRASTTGPSWPLAETELRARTNRRWLLAGRHDARPGADLHRRHRRAGPRRHALPRHDAAGPHRRGRRLRDRPEHPPRRLRRRARAPSSSTASPARPRSARAPASGRTPRSSPAP